MKSKVHQLLQLVDIGTEYSGTQIVDNRKESSLISVIEELWAYRDGNPVAWSADDEFNCRPFRYTLKEKEIAFKPRPTRRNNKVGVVERNNGTIKRIAECLTMADQESSPIKMLSRDTFLSN